MPEPYFLALGLSLGVFALLWPVSVAVRDVSIVDGWWGPGFLAATALVWRLSEAGGARAALILALVGVWAGRIGFVLIRRRLRHGAEDNRYVAIRESWGGSFWWKSFFIVFLLQGVLQWIVAFPAMAGVSASPAPLGWLGWAGAGIAVAGLLLEAQADAELDAFKKTAAPGDLLVAGLRAYVRHPNYLGEMIFWWGVWLIAAEAGAGWTVFGPITLCVLLTKISGAGITGEHLAASKPEFRAYAETTPAFLPRLVAKS